MKKIKISIIVPVYNSVSFLHRCIDSLIYQTLQEIEIILINDASTDNSMEILMEYKKKYPEKIIVIDSKINQRQGGARNLGIEIAKGKYIGFVDSDDWVEIDMFSTLYQEAIKCHSDICYAKRRQIDEKGKISKDSTNYYLPIGELTEDKRKKMLVNHITFIQRNIYKRSLLIENNIRFPVHLRYEDIFFDPLVFLYVKHIAAIDQTVYNYFIHDVSTVHHKNEHKFREKLSVSLLLLEEIQKRNYYEKYKNEFDYLYYRKGYIHIILNYLINVSKIKKEALSEIRSILLSVNLHYRNNPYYSQKISFVIIDKIVSSNSFFLLKMLQIVTKWFIKTI